MLIFSPHTKIWLFLLCAVCLLIFTIFAKPYLSFDGEEYLGMAISIANHGTPDLRSQDITERQAVNDRDGKIWTKGAYGYFKDIYGNYYSYHFWSYSALCALPFIILKYVQINPAMVFQVANALLLVLLLWWIFYRARLDNRMRVWFAVIVFFSPIWLFIQWSGPEVYSFSFLFIGLLELMAERTKTGYFFIAISSWQNPPIAAALLPSAITEIYAMWRAKKISWESIRAILVLSLVIFPFAFYWIHFHVPSLQIKTGTASLRHISLSKVINLFTDLNSGIIIYVPLLIAAMIVQLARLDKNAVRWAIIILMVAATITTNEPWIAGMRYISRYGVWMIPLIIMTGYGFFEKLPSRQLIWAIILYVMSTGAVTAYGLEDYKPSYIKFSPLARAVLYATPSFYNPPHEIFMDRLAGDWYAYRIKPPFICVDSSGHLIKALVAGADGRKHYINGPINLSRIFDTKEPVGIIRSNGEDIYNKALLIGFAKGWYSLEKSLNPRRGINNNANLFIYMPYDNNTALKIRLSSFARPRTCIISLNNEIVFKGVIQCSKSKDITFPASLKNGINVLAITSPEPSGAAFDQSGINSPRARRLSFMVSRIDIDTN